MQRRASITGIVMVVGQKISLGRIHAHQIVTLRRSDQFRPDPPPALTSAAYTASSLTNLVTADAYIACFDGKYTYSAWRPYTAIRAGDTDGNPATVADPTWTHLVRTPNHPEYPATMPA